MNSAQPSGTSILESSTSKDLFLMNPFLTSNFARSNSSVYFESLSQGKLPTSWMILPMLHAACIVSSDFDSIRILTPEGPNNGLAARKCAN